MATVSFSTLLRQPAAARNLMQQLVISARIPPLLMPLRPSIPFRPRILPQILLPLATTSFSNISSFLSGLWDSLLRAVPKKKTPYSRKRSRQLAGKALKDLINLNHCSGCGRVKRMHILCPHCVQNIKDMWAGRLEVRAEEASKVELENTLQRKQTTSTSMELKPKEK